MQIASSRSLILLMSISYNDDHYTTNTFKHVYVYIMYIYIYIYIYISYTHATKKPTAVQSTKPSSDNDFGGRYNFKAKVSLPLTQSTLAVHYNTTRFCWFYSVIGMPDQDDVSLLYLQLYSNKALIQWCKICQPCWLGL